MLALRRCLMTQLSEWISRVELGFLLTGPDKAWPYFPCSGPRMTLYTCLSITCAVHDCMYVFTLLVGRRHGISPSEPVASSNFVPQGCLLLALG